MLNAISWFEIPATDIGRAKKFYENIFDIEMQEMNFPNIKMALFPADQQGVGGALCESKDFFVPSHQGSLVYLNGGEDLSSILDKVEAAGGKILVPKTQIAPEHGNMAVFEDCEGNRVALHSMA